MQGNLKQIDQDACLSSKIKTKKKKPSEYYLLCSQNLSITKIVNSS